MECPHCGAYNADDAPDCRKCGQVFPRPELSWWRKCLGGRPLEYSILAGLIFFLLAMIVSNLLESRQNKTGSEKARVRRDLRTLTIALETYFLDQHAFPDWSLKKEENAYGSLVDKASALAGIPTFRLQHGSHLATLTTPISYITSYFTDPFAPVKGASFGYWTDVDKDTTAPGFIIWSAGPDGKYDITIDNVARAYTPRHSVPSPALIKLTYDPSNGSDSAGDIYRVRQ